MIPARISIVTLGAHDMPTLRAFYRSLGWQEEAGSDTHSMFHTGGGMLALFPYTALAVDAGVQPESGGRGYRGVTLAINLETREMVDEAFETLRGLGATITKQPVETSWGGYSGYFADPEGNLWEIAWGSFYSIDERGALVLHS
jgi:uncharacterized protein